LANAIPVSPEHWNWLSVTQIFLSIKQDHTFDQQTGSHYG